MLRGLKTAYKGVTVGPLFRLGSKHCLAPDPGAPIGYSLDPDLRNGTGWRSWWPCASLVVALHLLASGCGSHIASAKIMISAPIRFLAI